MHVQRTREIRVLIAARRSALASFHEALAGAGMRVVARCTSRRQVLAALAEASPDVCVVERELDGGGLVAAAAIAAPHPAPRVLLVGGHGSEAELRAARLAGAAGCLPGDVDASGLVTAVAELAQATASGQPQTRFDRR